MKVHLIRKETIEEFTRLNIQSRLPFKEWLTKVKYADWNESAGLEAIQNMIKCATIIHNTQLVYTN